MNRLFGFVLISIISLSACRSDKEVDFRLIISPSDKIVTSKESNYLHNNRQQNNDWYLLTIQEKIVGEYIIEFDNSQTDWIDIYLQDTMHYPEPIFSGGDKVAFTDREIAHRNTIFKTTLPGPFLINIRNRGGYLIPFHVYHRDDFLAWDFRRSIWIGIGLGSVLIFLIIAVGVLIKSHFHLPIIYYWLFTVFTFLFFLEELGLADMFIWPNHPHLEEPAIFFIILGSMISLILLVFKIFQLEKAKKSLLHIQRILLGIGLVFVVLLTIGILQNNLAFSIYYNAVLSYVVLVFVFVVWVGIDAIKRQVPYAIYFLGSFLFFVFGSLMKPLALLGIIPHNYIVQYGGFIGQIINIVALAILFIWQYFKEAEAKSKLESQMVNLERSALQAQMNPHFIFNSLNSVQNYIAKNDQRLAMDYLSKFALLIRKTLNASAQKYITLQDEIMLLNGYLEMEKIRFKDRFDYQVEVDPRLDLHADKIPPLMIQPFVENAIIHAFKGITWKGMLYVGFTQKNDFLEVEVIDNGRGMQAKDSPTHKSLAMDITAKRIIFNNKRERSSDYQVISDASNNERSGTKVKLMIKLNSQ